MALLKVYGEINPSFHQRIPNWFIGHGEKSFQDGENERAFNAFRKALMIDPKNTEAAAARRRIKRLQ